MEDFVIIIQGASSHVPLMKDSFKGLNVIFSTWEGEEAKYSETDIVVYNKFTSFVGPANLNLQKVSTISGLELAKKMGFKRALKLRSDLIPTNVSEFLKLLDNNTFNFLCWHCHEVYPNCPGYLIDYLMSATIDDLLILWDITDMSWCTVPEIHITQQYISKLIDKTPINYFLSELSETNDLYWIKNKTNLSSYQANTRYDKFRKYDFETNKEHLNNNYIKFLKK